MSRIVRSVCPRGKRLGFFLLVSTLFEALPALAQDAVRPSLAGEEAAEARRQDIEHIPYNLVTGPIRYASAQPSASSITITSIFLKTVPRAISSFTR